ncbi:hypothetical protein CHS0354_004657 [Potamilus streckersoni]|uniref:Uncharacterized protein n=1 Tax=Potamilus streckersoni TaxID=2493646 RepID=A0AAE0VQE4_9BIVA|nr:hypothetical protein CHS0354_004657 [Potamilus streckersoni]
MICKALRQNLDPKMARAIRYFVYVIFAVTISIIIFLMWLERTHISHPLQLQRQFARQALGYQHRELSKNGLDYPVFIGNINSKEFEDNDLENYLKTISCSKLINGDTFEMQRGMNFLLMKNFSFPHRKDEQVAVDFQDCEKFKQRRGYITGSQPQEEVNFPIAYSILFHENLEQLERLLRVIYRPQNQYCIHVDRKSPDSLINSVRSLADCFENVFVASKLEIVIYASYTRLLADINCMKDLVNNGRPWEYLLNMASSELPLKTNSELVQILKVFNGSNDIHEVLSLRIFERFENKHFTFINEKTRTGYMIHTEKKKEDPPFDLVITKGNAYNIFSRAFVEFALTDEIAIDLLGWSADTLTPDEHYWATLNNLYSNDFLDTPGGYKGDPDKKPYIARYIGWKTEKLKDRCKAQKYVHNICVFSIADLPVLQGRMEVIANKFDITYDPLVYRCMEELIVNRTRSGAKIINIHKYKKLLFIGGNT